MFLHRLSQLLSIPCQLYCLREVIITTNRLHDYILGETGMDVRAGYNRYLNEYQSVLPQCQTGADA